MPRAHLCTSCGEDLALIAVTREGHYGWPMVACPNCSAKSVRSEGTDRRMWRRMRKRTKAVAGLLGRTAAFAALTAINLSLISAISDETQTLRKFAGTPGPLALLGFSAPAYNAAGLARARADWLDTGQNQALLIGAILSALTTSIFIVVLLRHRRCWLTIPAWGAWLALVSGFIVLGVPMLGHWVDPADQAWGTMLTTGGTVIVDLVSWCAVATMLTLLAVPAALLARGIARGFVRRQRWRARRRILKRKQTA